MYSLNNIKNEIRQYKTKQILNSGENDMFDNKINIEEVKKCLTEVSKEEDKQSESESQNIKFDLNKTLNDIKDDELFESIINLKNSHVG